MKRKMTKRTNKHKLKINAIHVHFIVMIAIFISITIAGVYICEQEIEARDPNYVPIEVIYDNFPKSMVKSGEAAVNVFTRIYNDKDTDVDYIVFYCNGEIEVVPRYNVTSFGEITLK